VDEVCGLAAKDDAAGLENVAEVAGFERGTGILLDQQDRNPKFAQARRPDRSTR